MAVAMPPIPDVRPSVPTPRPLSFSLTVPIMLPRKAKFSFADAKNSSILLPSNVLKSSINLPTNSDSLTLSTIPAMPSPIPAKASLMSFQSISRI